MASAKNKPLTKTECKRRALLGAEWFVNTHVNQTSPSWDANHGRVLYNYHLPSRQRVLGLSWSQGRAIMCLLSAYQTKRNAVYLETAVRCGDYLRYGLQSMDRRNRASFGAFREEVPVSRFSYPRDGIEGAFGLLMLHVVTGEADYLERCEIFADWYLNVAYDRKGGWVRGRVGFDDDNDRIGFSYIQGGGAPFFWHLYQLTGKAKYLTMLRRLADGLIQRFIDADSGAVVADKVGSHHAITINGRPVVFNDDGCSIALTCAHAAGGGRGKYLDIARRYADWIVNDCPRPTGRYVTNGMQSLFLTELSAVSGDASYARFAAELMAEQVQLQVLAPDQLDRHGGYRGEDENPEWYYPGSKSIDFLVTRTTAYSTLGLFRVAALAHGPSYSALGLDELKAVR